MSDPNSVKVSFDPRRDSVQELLSVALAHADENNPVQAVADLCIAMCIVGDLADVSDADQYPIMVAAAMPNAKKAADAFAAQVEAAAHGEG